MVTTTNWSRRRKVMSLMSLERARNFSNACGTKMSLTLISQIWNVIGSNLHTTSDACTSSLPNMEGFTNNTLPNSFELKDNSIVSKHSNQASKRIITRCTPNTNTKSNNILEVGDYLVSPIVVFFAQIGTTMFKWYLVSHTLFGKGLN
jgi:hypothetical protein